ncbi:hypothetical protein DL96DRAFT_1572207 [Flagelloscypha sp. PMI_526]|nr:hypothetical protein DL96DRAFT_1572207 [Flagelloscypha sp. PMI_526]
MQATLLRTATPFLYYPAARFALHPRSISAVQPRHAPSPTSPSYASTSSSPQTYSSSQKTPPEKLFTPDSPPIVEPVTPTDPSAPQTAGATPPPPKTEPRRRTIKSRKAALSITPEAVLRLQALQRGPTPQLIRIGVRNKGCAGLSYHLEYVTQPEKFDEIVEQDDVKVIIDSKALFSIIGSEMDWHEDALSSKFAFKNPNIKDACGCGESFTI